MKKFYVVFFLFLVATSGFAKGKDEKVVYEKKTKIDFEEKTVDGQFLSPDGAAVGGDKSLDFDSLLQPKANFRKVLNRDSGAVR